MRRSSLQPRTHWKRLPFSPEIHRAGFGAGRHRSETRSREEDIAGWRNYSVASAGGASAQRALSHIISKGVHTRIIFYHFGIYYILHRRGFQININSMTQREHAAYLGACQLLRDETYEPILRKEWIDLAEWQKEQEIHV